MAYSQVHPDLWTGELAASIRDSPEDLRMTVWAMTLWILTNPESNSIGLYPFSVARAAEALGGPLLKPLPSPSEGLVDPLERAFSALEILVRAGFVEHDQRLQMIWIRKFARHRFGKANGAPPKPGDNQIAAARKEFERYRKTKLGAAFLAEYAEFMGWEDAVQEIPSEALAEPLPSPSGALGKGSRVTSTKTSAKTRASKEQSARAKIPPEVLAFSQEVIRVLHDCSEADLLDSPLPRVFAAAAENARRYHDAFDGDPEPLCQAIRKAAEVYRSKNGGPPVSPNYYFPGVASDAARAYAAKPRPKPRGDSEGDQDGPPAWVTE